MKGRVLVIDDDPQIVKLFRAILEKGGYSVVCVLSGANLSDVLEASEFDLLVLDLNMPEPNGFELLKKSRVLLPGVPVLVISGYLHGRLLPAAKLLGATVTLGKIEAPTRLLETVNQLLQKRVHRKAG
jgi:NtrC-family two-component system response regulator AlgB